MGNVPENQPIPISPLMRAGTRGLPQPLTPLIGREAELDALLRLLTRDGARLVTLTGPPGIGKTRLGLAVASEWQQRTGGEVYYVPLAAVRNPAWVLSVLARTLGVPTAHGQPLLDRLVAALWGTETLLLLDNVEQVVGAAPDIAELLTRCPHLVALVTSRAVLRVRGEHEWPVPPLALPPSISASPATLAGYSSVALLVDRARAVDPTFSLTADNAASIAAICLRLEGIPLAIELAAARLKMFSPAMLSERLERGLSELRDGARDVPARHQTLSDAIAWSDGLLAPDERRLFQQLAVFVDGWTLDAAEAICAADESPMARQAVLDGLTSLLEKSLIQRTTSPDGTPRFGMLSMIREYALGHLQASGDWDSLSERHATYFLSFVETAAAHLYHATQARWIERLEQEVGNLRTALRWLIDHGDKEAALRFGAALENFWLIHDHLGTGQRWLDEILAMPGDAPPLVTAQARDALAALLVRQGEIDRARALHEVNLVLYHEVDDEALRAQTLLDLGSLHFITGDVERATTYFEDALAIGWWVGARRTVARTLNRLGEIARLRGDDAAAAARYEESLVIWRSLAEQERIAMVLHNLAPVVARLGDRPRALALFAESLSLSWELRNTHGTAICLIGIAGAISGGWATAIQAAQLLGAADALRASIGVQWEPADRAEYERSVRVVRGMLDDAAFEPAWTQGRALTLAEAVERAQRLLATPPGPSRLHRRPRTQLGGLTRREYEVALHVALGKTNREIAADLSIGEKTVEMHVSNCLTKLGLRSRAQLAAWVASSTSGQPSGASAEL